MAEAAGVQQQPEHGEFIEQLALHQQLQIHRQVGRLHQRRVVVQQPQPIAREQQPPVGVVVGIEALLQAAVRRAAASLLAELAAALVELIGRDAPYDQGNGALKGSVGDRELGLAVIPAAAGLQVRPAQHFAQEARGGMQARRALGCPLTQIPVFLPDLLEPHPGRIDPFPQPLALGQAVVGLLLQGCVQASHLLQQRPRQQAALQLDRLEADGGGGAGHGSKGGRRRRGRLLEAGWDCLRSDQG